MDHMLSDFLTNDKNPKALRYLVLAGVICFVEWVLIGVAAMTPSVIIRIPLFILAALMVPVAVRLAMKIHRS